MCIDQLFILYIHKAAAMSNYKKMLVDLSIWRGRGNTELLFPSDHSHPIFYATPLQLLTTGKGSAFLHVWWHWTMHHEWCAQTWNSTHIWICFWISICQTQIYVSMDCTPCKELSLRPTLRTGGSQKLNWSEPMFALEDRTHIFGTCCQDVYISLIPGTLHISRIFIGPRYTWSPI